MSAQHKVLNETARAPILSGPTELCSINLAPLSNELHANEFLSSPVAESTLTTPATPCFPVVAAIGRILGYAKFCMGYGMRTKVIFKFFTAFKSLLTPSALSNQPLSWIKELDRFSPVFKTFNFLNNGIKFAYYLNLACNPKLQEEFKQNRFWVYSQLGLRGFLFGVYIADFIAESTPINFMTALLSAAADIAEIIQLTYQLDLFKKELLKKEAAIKSLLKRLQATHPMQPEEQERCQQELKQLTVDYHQAYTKIKAIKRERLEASWFLTMSLLGVIATVLFITSPYTATIFASTLAITKASHMTATYIYEKMQKKKNALLAPSGEPTQEAINQSLDHIKLDGTTLSCSASVALCQQKTASSQIPAKAHRPSIQETIFLNPPDTITVASPAPIHADPAPPNVLIHAEESNPISVSQDVIPFNPMSNTQSISPDHLEDNSVPESGYATETEESDSHRTTPQPKQLRFQSDLKLAPGVKKAKMAAHHERLEGVLIEKAARIGKSNLSSSFSILEGFEETRRKERGLQHFPNPSLLFLSSDQRTGRQEGRQEERIKSPNRDVVA